MRERVTISIEPSTAAQVRRCAAQSRGGASAYIERLIRQDALRDAAEQHARWFAANPSWLGDAEAERDAATIADQA